VPNNRTKAPWPPTQPLVGTNPPAIKLPVDALGGVLGPATETIARILQTSEGTVAQSLLAAATLAAQRLVDVKLDGRRYVLSAVPRSLVECIYGKIMHFAVTSIAPTIPVFLWRRLSIGWIESGVEHCKVICTKRRRRTPIS